MESDLKKIIKSLEIEITKEQTNVILLAIHKNEDLNIINNIPCFNSVPINGYVYNTKIDCYCVQCYDYINVGLISISAIAKNSDWQARVPIPEILIDKYLNEFQKLNVEAFKNKYNEEFEFKYFQTISAN